MFELRKPFHIILPSNVKAKGDPNNTISAFTTTLSQRQVIPENLVVGMHEISYTMSWYTFSKPGKIIIKPYGFWRPISVTLELPPANYDDLSQIEKRKNEILEKAEIKGLELKDETGDDILTTTLPRMKYDVYSKKFAILFGGGDTVGQPSY